MQMEPDVARVAGAIGLFTRRWRDCFAVQSLDSISSHGACALLIRNIKKHIDNWAILS